MGSTFSCDIARAVSRRHPKRQRDLRRARDDLGGFARAVGWLDTLVLDEATELTDAASLLPFKSARGVSIPEEMPSRDRLQDTHRLAVLDELAILDTPPEPAFDDIADLASICCETRVAAVNFVDDKRHWTKAMVGVQNGQGTSVSSDQSFCAATVASPDGVISVSDTLASESWCSHPLVVAGPKIRFYAGASIVVAGERVGVVCVFGDEPHVAGEREHSALEALAKQASAQLELRKHNAELRELALRDALTGLANRALLGEHLESAIAARERHGGQVGVLYCDLDGFKAINDTRGHGVGDRLLCMVAERLCEATRSSDTVARIGGDEFVVVCPGLESSHELAAVQSRIAETVHAPTPSRVGMPSPRVSIGAAVLRDGETGSSVLARADADMYASKLQRALVGA
ncbi:MAG TPA: sensor domain-containing diguanylate cyclase [Thermoleophilaceae bacterium]|nr:sensor domain-containing diguanylate cyclase [Thermoleophilaceae bacterium]